MHQPPTTEAQQQQHHAANQHGSSIGHEQTAQHDQCCSQPDDHRDGLAKADDMGVGLPLRPSIGQKGAGFSHADRQVPCQEQCPQQRKSDIQLAAFHPEPQQCGQGEGESGDAETL